METDAEGAAYEAHITLADGSRATVKLDDSFTVTGTETGPDGPAAGPAAPADGPHDDDDSSDDVTSRHIDHVLSNDLRRAIPWQCGPGSLGARA